MADEWKKPDAPPPPMFAGKKERDLVKQINDEIIERVAGQQLLYFAIDMDYTNFHTLYGEAIEKSFLPPIRVYARVDYEGIQTKYSENIGLDKEASITVHFHKKRLTADQNLFVREGDFVKYGDIYYEIVTLSEPMQLFGQVEHKHEIVAKCVRARDTLFNGE
jgi:hypothetical protein